MRKIGSILLIIGLMAAAGCRRADVDTVSGQLIGHSECKIQSLAPLSGKSLRSDLEECLEYSFDGQGTLTLKHVNAAFNCCPGELHAEFSIQDNEICITERESAAQCDCDCLYDLDYRLEKLPARTYRLRIVNPYVNAPNAPLEVTLDLSHAGNGRHCQPRTAYPWIQ